MHEATAEWYRADDAVADLNTLAIECVAGPGAPLMPRTPGLADELYEHDGQQLTKREVRGDDARGVGPGPGVNCSGTSAPAAARSASTWMRSHPDCRAVAIEPDAGRVAMIATNAAAALGTPGLEVVSGRAGRSARRAGPPGRRLRGAAGSPSRGLLDRCWVGARARWTPGSQRRCRSRERAVLDHWQRAHGGSLTRIAITPMRAARTLSRLATADAGDPARRDEGSRRSGRDDGARRSTSNESVGRISAA